VFRYWYSEDEDKKHVEKGQYRDGIKNKWDELKERRKTA
jgi:hypothetical protein